MPSSCQYLNSIQRLTRTGQNVWQIIIQLSSVQYCCCGQTFPAPTSQTSWAHTFLTGCGTGFRARARARARTHAHTHTHTHVDKQQTPLQPHIVLMLSYSKARWSRYRPGVAQRVGRGIALLFHDRGTRRGWVASSTPRPHFTPGKDPVPILQEARWAPGPLWTGGKSRPHRDSMAERPARSSVAIPTELPGPLLSYSPHVIT